jgi:predicted dehydrogenase
MPRTFRVAAIGSSQRGGFGHGLDSCFDQLPGAEYVAIADDDPGGLRAAGQKFGVTKLYADYRELLDRERPDVVSIGPRWIDQRVAMTRAAAAAGCHIYCEKPLAGSLADADAMLAACDSAGVKMAVAHQFRAMPPLRRALADVRAGKHGRLARMWARPKDDHRGGGEELIVHGTHLLDIMVMFAGPPRWVSGHIAQGSRDATRDDRRAATEPLGPVMGDSLSVTIGFDAGVRGFFDSTRDAFRDGRSPYGVLLECERALLHIRARGEVFTYPSPFAVPEEPGLTWERTMIADWHFTPERLPRDLGNYLHLGNQSLVRDLFAAIEEDRPPLASAVDARYALEVIQGTYASHLAGGLRMPIPLETRRHPLEEA